MQKQRCSEHRYGYKLHRQTTAQMRIYQTMVAIDGVRSYIYVRADNMSEAFDCALMRTNARNPQSYVEVIAAQELREPVDTYIRPVEVSLTPSGK